MLRAAARISRHKGQRGVTTVTAKYGVRFGELNTNLRLNLKFGAALLASMTRYSITHLRMLRQTQF